MLALILWNALAYFLVVTLFKLYKNPSLWPHMIAFLPLTGFMAYARMKGMTMLAWQGAFIFAGILTIVVVAMQLYKKLSLTVLCWAPICFYWLVPSHFYVRSALFYTGTGCIRERSLWHVLLL